MRPFEGDSNLALITSRDEKDALELVRHDFAHVLAEAVQNIFPGTQITFGPATEDGFYYDFAPAPGRGQFTEEDLPAIEEEMRRVIAADKPLVREVWDRERVRQFFIDHGESVQGRVGDGAARGRANHHVQDRAWRGRLDRPVPRTAPRLDRQARPQRIQADPSVRRLLARRPQEPDARAASTVRPGSTGSSSTSTSSGWRRRPSATTARSARRWTCSTSRRRRTAASSGTRTATSSGGSWRRTCADGSTRRATRK